MSLSTANYGQNRTLKIIIIIISKIKQEKSHFTPEGLVKPCKKNIKKTCEFEE